MERRELQTSKGFDKEIKEKISLACTITTTVRLAHVSLQVMQITYTIISTWMLVACPTPVMMLLLASSSRLSKGSCTRGRINIALRVQRYTMAMMHEASSQRPVITRTELPCGCHGTPVDMNLRYQTPRLDTYSSYTAAKLIGYV